MQLSPVRAIVFGALTVGCLDGLDAIIFFGFRGASPLRIFQSIASGLLGKASFQGGITTALLGVAIHFGIALAVVAFYAWASQHLPALARQPLVWGSLYGIGVYLVMNLVVLPLSAAASPAPSLPVLVNGLAIHIVGVGVPSALFAQAAVVPGG